MPKDGSRRSLWATAEKKTGKPVGDITLDDLLALPPNTQTSDGRGGSQVISGQIDSRLFRIIQEQMHSEATPHKTPSDVLRDALFAWAIICEQKYFDGEYAAKWQRLLELQKNKMELHSRNEIQEDAKEYAREVELMTESSPAEACASVERQIAILAGQDDYALGMYLGAMKKAGIHRELANHLPKSVVRLIEKGRQ